MKMLLTIVGIFATVGLSSIPDVSHAADKSPSGAELFKLHCALCHPDGGNIVNPKKTLRAEDRKRSKIEKPDDIVSLIRKPGPGMMPFDKATVSDADAQKIAEYILKTFK